MPKNMTEKILNIEECPDLTFYLVRKDFYEKNNR